MPPGFQLTLGPVPCWDDLDPGQQVKLLAYEEARAHDDFLATDSGDNPVLSKAAG